MATILPDLAAGLIDYRRERLDGAYEKARSYSPPFSGAMWPWESAFTGTEVCPSWAPTGLREIHISGDVACFVWWLFRMQQQGGSNLTWLRETAWPILAGTADYWLSRATTRGDGSLSIDDLIPPDEYADHVNNSAFTNAVAKLTLRHAVDAAALLGVANASVAAWRDADARLSVPYNASAAWHPEYDGYVQGTVIKQADVVLLGFPLQFADATMTPASRENDLDVYFRASDPDGPAMTWSMHAIGFAELDNQEAAGEMLNLTIANAHGDFGVWRETPSGGCPNFITGAAGYLQALLFGYPRLRLNDTALTLSSPMLVDGASSHTIRGLAYLGNRVDITYDAASITFALQLSAACASPAAPARRYRAAPPASQGVSLQHALRSSAECQRGRVAIGGRAVEPRALVVTTGDGVRHALAPGAPVTLPVADVFAVSAAEPAQAPLAALAEARRRQQ